MALPPIASCPHGYGRQRHFAEWMALDDSWIDFPEGCENLIRCNPNTGITDQEMKQLIDWLKK